MARAIKPSPRPTRWLRGTDLVCGLQWLVEKSGQEPV